MLTKLSMVKSKFEFGLSQLVPELVLSHYSDYWNAYHSKETEIGKDDKK